MKKNLTELVFILDKSGSMANLEQDTIGGFNAMIEAASASFLVFFSITRRRSFMTESRSLRYHR